MTEPQVRPDSEQLRAFEQLMLQQGADAFAAGPAPWESWSDIEHNHTWQGSTDPAQPARAARPRKPPQSTMPERVLAGITRLMVLVLLVGIAGVYFSSLPVDRQVATGIKPAPLVVASNTIGHPDAAAPVVADSTAPAPDFAALPAPAAGAVERPDPGLASRQPPAPATVQASVTSTEQAQTLFVPVSAEKSLAVAAQPALAEHPSQTAPVDGAEQQAMAAPPPAELPAPEPLADAATAASQQPFIAWESDETDGGTTGAAPAESPLEHAPATGATLALNIPASAASQPAAPAEAARQVDTGTDTAPRWVVNLAAYNSETIARRMLEKFRAKGVEAELINITVNGKPMIRLRTTGHESYREALGWSELLEERLDLEGTWVSKR